MKPTTTGNAGEWSELYALLKILGDGTLPQGDEDFQIDQALKYDVKSIERYEKIAHNLKKLNNYQVDENGIRVLVDGCEVLMLPRDKCIEMSKLLLSEIKEGQGRSFRLSNEACDFLKEMHCYSKSQSSDKKADLSVRVHDHDTGSNPLLGFSIKSYLKGAPTLINSSKDNTNFTFELKTALSDAEVESINEINSKSKIKSRLRAVLEKTELVFSHCEGETYAGNLRLLDGDLARIIGEALLIYYAGERLSRTIDICRKLETENPLDFPLGEGQPFYSFKLKKFFLESALGMMPNTQWSGKYEVCGGYIIVKSEGDLISYHLIRKNLFEDYLFKFTKFDTPSSTRHQFGTIYKVGDKQYFKLNLQIRFLDPSSE